MGGKLRGAGRRCAAGVSLAVGLVSCTADDSDTGGPTRAYVAADATVFWQQVVVDAWINRASGPDLGAIHGHAWDLWSALTAPTDQVVNGTTLPVWETWYDGAEVFGDLKQPTDPLRTDPTRPSTP